MNPLAVLPLVNVLLATILAVVVLRRNPRALVTRAFGLCVLTVVVVELGHFLARISSHGFGVLFWYQVSLAGLLFLPLAWSLFSFVLFQPHPEEILRKQRFTLILQCVLSAGFLLALITNRLISLPRGTESQWLGAIRFTTLGRWSLIYLLLSVVLVLIALDSAHRGVRRKSGRHTLYGLMGGFFYLIFLCSQGLLYSRIPSSALDLGSVIVTIAGLLMAYDITRHRLLQVDIFVGRGVIYSSAILLLVGGYLVLVGLLAKAVKIIGGNVSLFITILAAFVMLFMLLALLLSGSLKRRLKIFIDRNFYRGRYDYHEQWLRFSEEMSSLLDLDVIVVRFLQMALETVDTKRGVVFMPRDLVGDFEIVAQIGLDGCQLRIPRESDILDWLFVLSQAIELDDVRFSSKSASQVLLYRDRLKELGLMVLVPLITKRRLVGLLVLGPSHSEESYSNVDLELLEAIGNHLSMAILNAKLSQELVINRELEFMHKVSSFVIHDLKNSVSTLSMLLQNAATNMENPEFRESMLGTIGSTVEKMTALMGKIRTMPQDGKLNRKPQDLNQIIREVVSKTKVDRMKTVQYVENLQPLLSVNVDREHMERVFTNLIINALEAMSQKGTLKVSTRMRDNGSPASAEEGGELRPDVEIEVTDSGVGMSPEFIRDRLFRPFQTTKKKGLGIGLYQCRETVEAHGGRIEVHSVENEGTTFTIRLPTFFSTFMKP